jgi:serine/threonine protein kinase
MLESVTLVDELQPGSLIGDFEIIDQIGAGGISRVFRARQLSLEREVALKVTEQRDGSAGVSAEGQVLATLRHENIVSVFSEVVTDSCRILAMPLIEGPSLAQLIATLDLERANGARLTDEDCRAFVRQACRSEFLTGSPSSVAADSAEATKNGTLASFSARTARVVKGERSGLCLFACEVVRQLALALQHTHERGVLHGDVKPANVLFSSEAKPLLTDFNVSGRSESRFKGAVAVNDPGCDTRPGESTDSPIGGTLLYMAPEQLGAICGMKGTGMDHRADIYSLGLVLFELLTGKWPFPEAGIGHDPLLAPRQLYASRLSSTVEFPGSGQSLESQMRAVIRRCLEPNPEERYQSASDLANDLQCIIDCRPLLVAETPILRRRASCFVRRHRLASLTSVVCVGLFLAGTLMLAGPPGRSLADSHGREARGNAEMRQARQETERHIPSRRWEQSGRVALAAGDFEQAVSDLQRAVDLVPGDAAACHNLGIALFRTSRFAEARAAFDAAIEAGLRSGRAYSYRAASSLALGDVAGARADFELARQVASNAERQEIETNYQTFLARTDIE